VIRLDRLYDGHAAIDLMMIPVQNSGIQVVIGREWGWWGGPQPRDVARAGGAGKSGRYDGRGDGVHA
jgi:hypothetical protein